MFEEFCKINQITKNYKEAFYHHLMAKYSEYDSADIVIDNLKEEEYKQEWKIILLQIFESLKIK